MERLAFGALGLAIGLFAAAAFLSLYPDKGAGAPKPQDQCARGHDYPAEILDLPIEHMRYVRPLCR